MPINYEPADPLATPAHIVPEWYFLPFYAILRAIPDKLRGVIAMFGSILILFVLPWLDTSRVRSGTYRPVFKQFFWIFVDACCIGARLSRVEAAGRLPMYFWSRILTLYYFLHFLVILPLARPARDAEAAAVVDLGCGAGQEEARFPGKPAGE